MLNYNNLRYAGVYKSTGDTELKRLVACKYNKDLYCLRRSCLLLGGCTSRVDVETLTVFCAKVPLQQNLRLVFPYQGNLNIIILIVLK